MNTGEWPFRACEQLAAGSLTARELRRFHVAVYPGVWMPRGAELDALGRGRAAWLWTKRRGVLSGASAAAALGAKWVEPELPAEVVHRNRRPPPGVTVHSDALGSDEITHVAGLPVTTAARTAFDLGRRLPTGNAVQRIDALMNATDLVVGDIDQVAEHHPGVRGLRQLYDVLALVDGGSESPYESLTRLLLVQAGLPRPQTQIEVRGDSGRVFARLDMGWRRWRVAVEYDGAQHWTDSRQRAWDIDRTALLEAAGWVVIRVSADMLKRRHVIVERVQAALGARGWSGTPRPVAVVSVQSGPPASAGRG